MMTEVGLEEVEMYVLRCQNITAQYIVTRTIMEICLAAEIRKGVQVTMRLWDQAGLDLGQEEADTADEGEREDIVESAVEERRGTDE